jgi:hypothetical protein
LKKTFARLLQGLIWSGRAILWLLMQVGRAVNCLVLRHMEYDADAYEVKVGGSDIFRETSLRMAELSAFHDLAIRSMSETYRSGRLPDNFPLYVSSFDKAVPEENLARLRQKWLEETTGLLDSHPGLANRVAKVEKLSEPGLFHVELPGGRLLSGFSSLCRAVTAHFYRQELDLPTDEVKLVDTGESIMETGKKDEERALLFDLLGEGVAYLYPLRLPPTGGEGQALADDELGKLREAMEAALRESLDWSERIDDLEVARAFVENEFHLKSGESGWEGVSRSELAEKWGEWNEARDRADAALLVEQQRLARHLWAGLQRVPDDSHRRRDELTAALQVLADASAATHKACSIARAMFVLMEAIVHQPEPDRILAYSSGMAGTIQDLLQESRIPLRGVVYPYEHVQQGFSLAAFATRPARKDEAFIIKAYQDALYQGESLSELYLQVLAGLVQLAVTGLSPVRESGVAPFE